MATIYHIVPRREWEAAVKLGVYIPGSLMSEGFIHCSTREQVVDTANLLFKGQSDLVLLQIDEDDLAKRPLYEDLYSSGKQFPHIYDSLKPHEVSAVHDFPCGPEGTFKWKD